MCLAMVYKKEQKPENLVLSNVQRIDCQDGQIILTGNTALIVPDED